MHTSRNQIAFKAAVQVLWLNSSIFSTSSYSGSRTFKAHYDTLLAVAWSRRGARGGGRPQSSPKMSFAILSNPLRYCIAAFFSNTCSSVVCQCYKGNRNEILELINDILARFSQQK